MIKGGHIVTAVDDYLADVFIDGETVRQIGSNLNVHHDPRRHRQAGHPAGGQAKITFPFVFARGG